MKEDLFMITILFRTNEDNLPSKLCLDTATSIYMSPDRKVIVETEGGIDYISGNEIGETRFETCLRNGYDEGRLDLTEQEFGLFDIYEPFEDIGDDDEDDED